LFHLIQYLSLFHCLLYQILDTNNGAPEFLRAENTDTVYLMQNQRN